MNPRLVITYLICLISVSSIFASNRWEDFDANTIYPKYNTSNCKFPFEYRGKNYTNCTTDGDNGNRPWCSLSHKYVGLFTYCYDFWDSSLKCQLPFTLNSRTFDKCDFLSRTSVYKQCRSNDPNYRFRFCIEEHVKRNDKPLLHTGTCDPVYRSMSEYHSKCAGPSEFAIPVKITSDEKQSILDTHNRYRAEVNARTMMKMYWDDELADMAQVHSDMCAFDHDESNNRLTMNYKWKNGQNMVMSTEIRNSLSDLLSIMFDSEKPRFEYGKGCNPPGSCTHYTQLMLSNMTRLGCGVTHCLFPDRIERYLTCNYIHAQYSHNFMIPYPTGGSAGSDCPATKDSNNLCDCKDKICQFEKGEQINPNTCSCEGGSGKRSVGEDDFQERSNDDDDVLENGNKASIAIKEGEPVEIDRREERSIQFIPAGIHRGKRNLRKLHLLQREHGQIEGDSDSAETFAETNVARK